MMGRLLLVASLVCLAPSLAQAQAGASLDAPAPATDGPPAAQLPPIVSNEIDEEPLRTPRHPVAHIATGVPLVTAGLVVGSIGAWGAAQPGCSGGWFCIDVRPIFGAMAAAGGLMLLIGVGLLVHGGSRWAGVDRELDERRRAGELVLDARGIGVRF